MPEQFSSSDIFQTLTRFGKTSFRPKQQELIECALAGKPCIGVLPTGSGKSLCYQIPAVMLGRLSVIVSPLIALMRDQVNGLQELGVPCARYDSSLNREEAELVLAQASQGEIRMLFVAPESLASPQVKRALESAQLGLFVIDEAHCVSEWWHSSRPDYLALPDYARSLPFHSVMALTATATEKVRADLASVFHVSEDHVYALSPARENIVRRVFRPGRTQKEDLLAELLRDTDHLPAIVYASTRNSTEDTAAFLSRQGIACKSYHAGMPAETRALVQEQFLTGEIPVLIATIAFGMGIDKADVRSVIHYHFPSSPEAYVQESGRAGRDGLPARSIVLYHDDDYQSADSRIKAALPDEASLALLMNRILARGENALSIYGCTTECDVSETVFSRVLFHLEREGLVETIAKGYQYYKVKPLYPLSTILSGRDGEESERLAWLDNNREGEISGLAVSAGISWPDSYTWLEELANTGEWQVQFRQRALLVKSMAAKDAAAVKTREYIDSFTRQAAHDRERLDSIRRFLLQDSCLGNEIDHYFGFGQSTPCGHCSFCLCEIPLPPAEEKKRKGIADDVFEQIAELCKNPGPALNRPHQLTRFLLGLPGPAALRARLWNQPLYGSLSHCHWDDVHAVSLALMPK